MKPRPINAADGPPSAGGYSQAIELTGHKRLLFVSGQIPTDASGAVPAGFEAQARQVWANVVVQLAAAGMSVENIVKVTTFLSAREHADVNGAVRREVLGAHKPALTVIIATIYDPAWLLEIEVIAAG
jgi:2-iminobutanoate/2-iminopropanoate deaminase